MLKLSNDGTHCHGLSSRAQGKMEEKGPSRAEARQATGRGRAGSSAVRKSELQGVPGWWDDAGHVVEFGHKSSVSIESRRHRRG